MVIEIISLLLTMAPLKGMMGALAPFIHLVNKYLTKYLSQFFRMHHFFQHQMKFDSIQLNLTTCNKIMQ